MREHLGHYFVFFLLLMGSAFFSASEAALFSLGRVRLQTILDSGHERGKLLDLLLSQPRRLLVTILVGNELVNIGASIVAAGYWEQVLGADYGFWAILGITTATALPLILFFGEVIPKTLAVKNGELVALLVCRPIYFFGSLISPVRWVLRGLADLMVKPFGGAQKPADDGMSEQDFRALLDVSEREGVIEAEEHQWIRNALEFDDRPVHRVMTSRENVTALPLSITPAELVERVREAGYSRVPIFDRKPDRIVGVLYTKDLLRYVRGGDLTQMPPLQTLLRAPVFLPRTLSAAEAFRELRARRTHMALVVDEFGNLVGVVTMEDLLEELVGEIADERDRDEAMGGRRPIRTSRAVQPPPPPSAKGAGGAHGTQGVQGAQGTAAPSGGAEHASKDEAR